jgi:hypothetical protein
MRKFISILLFILTIIILDLNNVSATSWYYLDWPSRQMISLTNSVSTPEDYQVKIIFNSSNIDYSKTNDDGSDLRFTYYNIVGEEEGASYWIEKWNETGKSVVWIKAPKIDGIYYVYYGNDEAFSESNPEATFDFYDDFSSGMIDTSKWERVREFGQHSANNYYMNLYVNKSAGGSWEGEMWKIIKKFNDSIVIQSKVMVPYSYYGNVGVYTFSPMIVGNELILDDFWYFDDTWYHYALTISRGAEGLDRDEGARVRLYGGGGTSYNLGDEILNSWENIKLNVIREDDNNKKFELYRNTDLRNSAYWSGIDAGNLDSVVSFGVNVYEAGGLEINVDDVIIRKYSSQEPTYTVGEIESREPPGLMDTDVENLFTGSIHELTESLLGGKYVYSVITAWISNDDSIHSVNSNLSAPSGFLDSNVVPMTRIEEGEYSRTIAAHSLKMAELALDVLLPWLQGAMLEFLIETQPEIRWDYVTMNATWGDSYPYMVNEKLPTVLGGLPNRFLGRATAFVSLCPVDMLVIDPEGRRTGSLYENGEFMGIVNEIEKSVYTGRGTEPEFVVIFDPVDGEYVIRIYGNDTGLYNFSVISVDNGSVFYGKNYTDVPIGQEEIQTYEEPITDTEPPEAVIGYDIVSEELVVEGKDNFDKDVDVTYEEECSRSFFGRCMETERDYKLTDDAGNQLILRTKYNKISYSHKYNSFSFSYARLLNAEYTAGNGFKEVEYESNWLSYSTNKKSGEIKRFSQNTYVKDKGFARASYESKKNETRIISNWGNERGVDILEGLHIYGVITDSEEMIRIAS